MRPSSNLFTVEDIADWLRLSQKTVYGWLRSGDLPGVKIGQVWRIKEEDLMQFIEDHYGGKADENNEDDEREYNSHYDYIQSK